MPLGDLLSLGPVDPAIRRRQQARGHEVAVRQAVCNALNLQVSRSQASDEIANRHGRNEIVARNSLDGSRLIRDVDGRDMDAVAFDTDDSTAKMHLSAAVGYSAGDLFP